MTASGPGRVERELKLGADPDLELPDLDGIAPGVTAASEPALDLDATYVDTTDLRLARAGVSLRRRTGEGAPRWTLKLPTAVEGTGLARRELDVEDDGHQVPAVLAGLVTGWARTAELVPVAVIRTHRRRVRLAGADGGELAEVADDQVTVVQGDRVTQRFREIEVELEAEGDDRLLQVVGDALVAAGAGAPDATSKVVRALGDAALVPPDPVAPAVGPASSVAEVVRAALAEPVQLIVATDHAVRLDDEGDGDGVRHARSAVRRLRAALALLAPVLEPDWADELHARTGSMADALGEVRHVDALVEQLRRSIGALPASDRDAAVRLVGSLDDRRRAAFGALVALLSSASHVELLDDLVTAATAPRLADDANPTGPAVDVLPGLVSPAWHHLHHSVGHLGAPDDPTEVAELRPAVRRARLAVALAAPVVGERTGVLASGLADLHEVLSALRHALVAEAWLAEVMPALGADERTAAEQLLEVQQADVRSAVGRWRAAWSLCDSDAATGWLR